VKFAFSNANFVQFFETKGVLGVIVDGVVALLLAQIFVGQTAFISLAITLPGDFLDLDFFDRGPTNLSSLYFHSCTKIFMLISTQGLWSRHFGIKIILLEKSLLRL